MHTKQSTPPLTNTWVFIEFIDKLKNGSIKSIKLMGRELVLWRTASGKISLLDAYCPHMGAHLGRGKVQDEKLECLFHKRRFNIAGECLGAGKPTQRYPIFLNNNMIFAWMGTLAPLWNMPDLFTGFPEQPESQWKIVKSHQFNLNFHAKGMAENDVDASHFKCFHHFCHSYEPVNILEMNDHQFISKLVFTGHPMLRALRMSHQIEIVAENFGACVLIINTSVKLKKRNFYFKLFYLATPREGENTQYTLAVATQHSTAHRFSIGRKIFEYAYATQVAWSQWWEFYQESKKIWEPKTYLSHPDFSNQEPAMKAFHEWYSQFYLTHHSSAIPRKEMV